MIKHFNNGLKNYTDFHLSSCTKIKHNVYITNYTKAKQFFFFLNLRHQINLLVSMLSILRYFNEHFLTFSAW